MSVNFSRSVVSNSATPWTAACQGSLYITNSQSLLKLMSIELAIQSNHLILYTVLGVFKFHSFTCSCPVFLAPLIEEAVISPEVFLLFSSRWHYSTSFLVSLTLHCLWLWLSIGTGYPGVGEDS